MSEFLKNLAQNYKDKFEKDKRLLTFNEFLEEMEKKPHLFFRNATQYLLDTFDHFGTEKIYSLGKSINRFKLFNSEFTESNINSVIGEEKVQNKIYKILQNFIAEGISNKLILLHGPNGSSKSSIINSIMLAMEHYSHTDDGVIYKFNWVFPLKDKEKGNIGFHNLPEDDDGKSYAKLDPKKVLSKLHCDIKDPPIFLIPPNDRIKLIEKLKEKSVTFSKCKLSKYILEGTLCKKCSQIFEALLASYNGNYEEVLSHVEVERIFISKRYSMGAITIEPQLHIDAKSSMVTYDKSLSLLPPVLQNMNFFIESGPLINASRGILEFSDLLKRPLDAWKYLLTTTETSTINIGDSILHLDLVLFGTCNENQLDAFKKSPDFSSFKGRMELVRVPFLLEFEKEQKIYDIQLKCSNHPKHLTPHTTKIASLWAILTRLKKPDNIHFKDELHPVIQKLTPLDKALFYNSAEFSPKNFTGEEKKLVLGNISNFINEYEQSPFYEGRIGASAREIKTIILNSLQNQQFKCLSPFSIFYEIEELSQKNSEYDFLNIETRDGYHDIKFFMHSIKNFYFEIIENEILGSLGFYEETDYENFLNKYMLNVMHYLKQEKLKNIKTGISEDPDENFMKNFEVQIGVDPKKKDEFRNDILSTIGAYNIDNPDKKVVFKDIFPTYFKKLREYNYNRHKAEIEKLKPDLEKYFATRSIDKLGKTAKTTIDNLVKKFDYCTHCAPEILYYYIKIKYNVSPLLPQ